MLGLTYFFALGLVLVFTHGHFAPNQLLALLALHLAFTVAELHRTGAEVAMPWRNEVVLAMLLGFSLFLVYSDQLIYPQNAVAHQRLRSFLGWLPVLVVLAYLALRWRWPDERVGRIGLYVTLAAMAVVFVASRTLVLSASPQPFIDVWTSSVQAVKYFLEGKNPYTQSYVDIYQGRYDYIPSFPYLPGYLLWATGWAWVSGSSDVRVSLVAAELITSGLLLGFFRRLGLEWPTALVLVALWLGFPIDLFVLEQAWLDPLLLMGFVGAAWALTARRWLACGALLGFTLATKQYALVGVAFFLLYVWRVHGLKTAGRMAAAGAVIALVLCLPFLIANPKQFWLYAVTSWASALPRLDSLSFPAWVAHKAGVADAEGLKRLFAPFTWLSFGVWIALLVWFWRHKAPTLRELFVGASVSYGWMLLFAKQSFCNYYYFLSFFVLAVTACAWAPPEKKLADEV